MLPSLARTLSRSTRAVVLTHARPAPILARSHDQAVPSLPRTTAQAVFSFEGVLAATEGWTGVGGGSRGATRAASVVNT
jgi:hypothetical protein